MPTEGFGFQFETIDRDLFPLRQKGPALIFKRDQRLRKGTSTKNSSSRSISPLGYSKPKRAHELAATTSATHFAPASPYGPVCAQESLRDRDADGRAGWRCDWLPIVAWRCRERAVRVHAGAELGLMRGHGARAIAPAGVLLARSIINKSWND
jgi:hypothetical protein